MTPQERREALMREAGIGPVSADIASALVESWIFEARHTVNGRCRYCGGPATLGDPEHQMDCRFYIGPLEHQWVRISPNGTFGGMDHYCSCGGWFRLGGIAGHGDGTATAKPVCPHADETQRPA